jgi:GTP pyrophosphokinase
MQHSRIVNTESRTRQAWIDRFWVSDNEKDYHLLGQAVGAVLQAPPPTDLLQPCSLDVAEILRHLDVDQMTLIAALLCDYRLVQTFSLEEIERDYGESVRVICENVRSLHRFHDCSEAISPATTSDKEGEQLRRMMLAMVRDMRAIVIQLAWSLQYLRLLARQDISGLHHCVAHLVMDLYAPWANRLGISQVKWELEDLSFRFLHPETYKEIAKSLTGKRIEREQFIADFIQQLKALLAEQNIKADVFGRPKHIYSIWKKKDRKHLADINELYDLRAVRIIVEDKNTCYEVLGLVQNQWRSIREEFDDYIANRKDNGYQSIHTVVIGPKGKPVEIQIRTHEMHRQAEQGVASHWRYKEGSKTDPALEKVIAAVRRMLDTNETGQELLEDFRTEVFNDRVFVRTPKGKVVDMPKGATPVDFAYYVHTSIGHRCRGAKVNGNIVPLDYALQNGEQVEIITGKEERPRQDWANAELGYVKSGSVRQKIRQWFSQQNHEQNYRDGERVLEKERHLLNLKKLDYVEFARQFGRNGERDFVIAVGKGDISPAQIRSYLLRSREPEFKFRKVRNLEAVSNDIDVLGVKKLYTQIATCCHPVHGDPIVGYLSQGRGVIVHRADCPDLANLRKEREERIIDVAWGTNIAAYIADITVFTYNKAGVLGEIANLLTREKINIHSLHTRETNDPCFAIMDIALEIRDVWQLGEILEKLLQLSSVRDAQRKV